MYLFKIEVEVVQIEVQVFWIEVEVYASLDPRVVPSLAVCSAPKELFPFVMHVWHFAGLRITRAQPALPVPASGKALWCKINAYV